MSTPSPQPFDDGSVHIWRADLNRLETVRPELEAHLDSTERERASHFHFDSDRTRFVIGRGHLREILSRCTGVPPAELAIAYTPHGKPFLPDHRDWHFNVTHTQHRALFAVSYGREVGIDIELLRPEIPIHLLTPRVLCTREWHQLDQGEGAKMPLFLHYWTRKEAFLKANGYGITIPLPEIDVSNPGGQISLWNSQTGQWHLAEEWRVVPLDTFPDCLAAIAARGQNWTITRHEC